MSEEDILRLDVAVDELRAVHELERLEDLVHNVLLVYVHEDVRADHRVQVRLHVVEGEVDVAVVVGLDDGEQPHDVVEIGRAHV